MLNRGQSMLTRARGAPSPQRVALAAICALFAVRLALAFVVVPRWQGPDEPQHYLVSASVLRDLPAGEDAFVPLPPPVDTAVRALEGELIRSMARSGWWQYYGAQTPPEPLPTRLHEGPGLLSNAGGAAGGSRLYFTAASVVIRALGVSGVEREYDILRLLSSLWGLLTIGVAYVASRAWLDQPSALAVAGVVAFHPQFVIVASTVSPDAFVNFCGAVVWWQSVRALTNVRARTSIAATWIAAIAGMLARRLGTPLLGAAAIVTVATFGRQSRRQIVSAVATVAGVTALLAALLWLLWPAESHRIVNGILFRSYRVANATSPDVHTFTAVLWQSAWLTGGWLRFPPPGWWMLIANVWAIAALVGLGMLFGRSDRERRTIVVCAAGSALVQLTAIFVIYYWLIGSGAQGRYLFPVIVPLISLLVLGSAELVAALTGKRAEIWPITLMATLDVLGWSVVLIPAYSI
jgi:hypothetical protein